MLRACSPRRQRLRKIRLNPASLDGSAPSRWERSCPEIVWSVLDCPGGWTTHPVSRPRVLQWMTAEITERPHVGWRYIIVGRLEADAGRTVRPITTLYDAETGR
jgi:hypothetical protein